MDELRVLVENDRLLTSQKHLAPIPVVEMIPPVTARPKACVSLSKSAQVAPPCAVARRCCGSTVTVFMSDRSMTTPPSLLENPAMLCPRELHRFHHVSGAGAANDQCRVLVVSTVPDRSGLVVAAVGGQDDLTS